MYSGTATPQAYLPKSSCFRRQHNNKRPTSSTGCSGGNVIGVVKWHCLQYLSIWHKKSYKNTKKPLFSFVFKYNQKDSKYSSQHLNDWFTQPDLDSTQKSETPHSTQLLNTW